MKFIQSIEPPPKKELEHAYNGERRSSSSIGEIYQCSNFTVLKWLRMYKIRVRSNSDAQMGLHVGKKSARYIEPPPKEELERLYLKERKTPPEIGAIFGCSGYPVRKWLDMYSIRKRTPSEARMGKCVGRDNPLYIEPPPKEELERLYLEELKTPAVIGTLFNCDQNTVIRWLRQYKIPVRTAADVMRNIRNGENNHMWNGGSSFEPYCPKFNEAFKESIREAFGRVCFLCPTTEVENGRKLSVHHVNYNKDCLCDDSVCEFVPLCIQCHAKTNGDRDYWEAHIMTNLRHGDFVNTTEEL